MRCQYLAPIMMDDEIIVHLRVSRIGTRAWDFDYLITHADQGHPIATGRSTQVFFDYRTREVRPIPDSFAAAIERFEGQSLRGS
jgi:acyl-CoA thioester hydrolase